MSKWTRWAGVMLLLISGCGSIGPRTVQRDRFHYTTAIAESWKSQLLLNIVKLRYGDTPIFIDVPSVISQYAIQGNVSFGADWEASEQAVGDLVNILDTNSQMFGAGGSYAERPTITYTPLTGEKFTKSLLTPIPPASLLFLAQSGWPAKSLFQVCVKSINGINNRSTAFGLSRPADPKFQQLLEAIERIQAATGLGARIIRHDNAETAALILSGTAEPEIASDRQEIKGLLGIEPDATETAVTYGVTPAGDGEIAMLTRSTMDIIIEISSQIDVPDEHVAEGRTYATASEIGPNGERTPPLCRVHVGKGKPADSFTAIRYRNHWYWIDDRDRASKSKLTFLMILFSLAETGTVPQAPLITVPVQ